MNDLILQTPDNAKLKLTGLSSFNEIRLSTGKHTVSTFTRKTYLTGWAVHLGITALTLSIYEGVLFALHIPEAQFYFSTTLFMIYATVTALIISKTSLVGFHGAEHMTLRALESRQPFTKELIMKQNPVSESCGTIVITAFFIFGFIALLGKLAEIFAPSLPLTYQIAFSAFGLMGSSLLLFNFFRFNRWVQKTFFVAMPTEAQLNLAYEQGVALIQKYNANPHRQSFFQR